MKNFSENESNKSIKNRLENKRIDFEIRKKEDDIYTKIIITIGITILIVITGMVILNELKFYPSQLAIWIIGLFFFVTGSAWRYINDNHIKKIDEELKRLNPDDLESYRKNSEF